MTVLLVWATILGTVQAQSPGAGTIASPHRDTAARVATPARDTARSVVQMTPTITIEAPSQWPTLVLGVAGLILLGLQLVIMARQTNTMNRQTNLADKQTALLDRDSQRQRVEAASTFYRIAHDLVDEFKKADVLPTTQVPVNFDSHPRQMLREAGRLFAPLGTSVVRRVTEAASFVEQYFDAVLDYNVDLRKSDSAGRWTTIQELRKQVGLYLDMADQLIPAELRWRYDDGKDYNFARLCAMGEGLASAIMGDPGRGEFGGR